MPFASHPRTSPATVDLPTAVDAATAWLDAHHIPLTTRILKVTEEAGEVATAWIGATGGNPRKGTTHTHVDVTDELADVAFAALVAIRSLGHDPTHTLHRCAAKVTARATTPTPSPGRRAA